jgi:hypothetical protein
LAGVQVLHGQTVERQIARASAAAASRLVVLRNGEVLRGQATQTGDRVVISQPGREIRLRLRDVELIANTLEEAYQTKQARLRETDVEGRFQLAQWCTRHELWPAAHAELLKLERLKPDSARLSALASRVTELESASVSRASREHGQVFAESRADTSGWPRQVATTAAKEAVSWPATVSSPASSARPADHPRTNGPPDEAIDHSPQALDRFIKGLPSQAVEEYTRLQPTILRTCATAGCHAPGSPSTFVLLRPPYGVPVSRRLTQRNLHRIVQLVNFTKPEQSQLLKIAGQAHGPLQVGVFGDARSPKYRELVTWVTDLTGVKAEAAPEASDTTIAGDTTIAQQIWERATVAGLEAASLGRVSAAGPQKLQPNQPAAVRGTGNSPDVPPNDVPPNDVPPNDVPVRVSRPAGHRGR